MFERKPHVAHDRTASGQALGHMGPQRCCRIRQAGERWWRARLVPGLALRSLDGRAGARRPLQAGSQPQTPKGALFLESRDRVLVLRIDQEMPTMNHMPVQVRRTARRRLGPTRVGHGIVRGPSVGTPQYPVEDVLIPG